jgi:hypothetical protein
VIRAILFLLAVLPSWACAAPSCMPGLYGAQFGGAPIVPLVRGNAGWYAYGWCRADDGSPFPVYLLCAHGECTSDLGGQVGRALSTLGTQLLGSDPAAVYGGWWDANVRAFDCGAGGPQHTAPGTPRAAACNELAKLMARDRPAWVAPAAPTYRVKANGVALDRPAYALIDGARGTKELARAKVGQECSTKRPTLASGADLWAEFGPDRMPGVVALCSKQ